MVRFRSVAAAVAVSLLPVVATAQSPLATPTNWKWRQDAPAPLASGGTMAPGSWVFVQMPPGWHVTTGPGVLLDPTAQAEADGHFSIEAEIFLFPGESAEEYGVFLGGKDVDIQRDAQAGARTDQGGLNRKSGASSPPCACQTAGDIAAS
jgi:hypothetical protein